jgi:hypothetical protein
LTPFFLAVAEVAAGATRALAAGFHRRYRDLLELDDLRQEARLELVRAAARCQGNRPAGWNKR